MQQSRFTQKRFSGAATPDQIAELRRLYVDEEKTLKEIAEAVCHTVFDGTISKASISKLLTDSGVKLRRPGPKTGATPLIGDGAENGCGCGKRSRVTDSRPVAVAEFGGAIAVRRRRVCGCGARFNTFEVEERFLNKFSNASRSADTFKEELRRVIDTLTAIERKMR